MFASAEKEVRFVQIEETGKLHLREFGQNIVLMRIW